jgi:predicted signal transduction protein with EAL and GGDEF domain
MDKENHNSGSREVQYLLGRFRDRDLERQFQLEIRPQDRAYAIRVLVLISLVFVSFLPIELVELQTRSALIAVVLGRLGFVLWGALLIYALLHFRDKLQAEMAILLFVIGFGIASIVVYVTQDYLDPHGEGFMMATITYMIATLASYALFPARLSYQAAYAACLMGAYIFNAFMTPPDPSFHLSIIAMFFVATNAVGLVLSGRIHELRRTQWLALNQVRQRADDLKHEIEQREVLETRLREQANTDPLTGIFNRRNFFNLGTELFLQAQRYGRPLSAILFDVDHFKHINDS